MGSLENKNVEELERLAKEIREFLIDNVPRNGGHFASNLGVVELTIALHKVFGENDDIVFDVGHQSYVHKYLTGRKDVLTTIRNSGGISGFPRIDEGDSFGVGHSSTSISAALGIATAKKLKGEKGYSIAVIGDGALTGGLAFEALNNLKNSDDNVIIVLNDNAMSISKNVGAYSRYLTKFRTHPFYISFKQAIDFSLNRIPLVGKFLAKTAMRIKDSVRSILLPSTIFEKMGIGYIGPIDGHNLNELIPALERTKKFNYPILLHVLTVKGKGFTEAEKEPTSYHAVYPMGKTNLANTAETLRKLVMGDSEVVVVDAAMSKGLGLVEFAEQNPDRYFDVGIAEGHAVTYAAGLGSKGVRVIVPMYSSFLQRAYDQILHDVALQNLPVTFMVASCGLDKCGETHHGIFDMSMVANMPNMTVFAPSSIEQMDDMFDYAKGLNSPCVIRYPKELPLKTTPFVPNGMQIVQKGDGLTIFSIGDMLDVAMDVAEKVGQAEVIDVQSMRPLNVETIRASVNKTGRAITIENGMKQGGGGSLIAEVVPEFDVRNFGYDCERFPRFENVKSYGLTAERILEELGDFEGEQYASA